MATSVILLTLAAAPAGQWYLAWFALAPWLVSISQEKAMRGVLWRSWLAGVAYFGLNLWWLWTASISGTILLILWFALFWSLAAGLIFNWRLLRPAARFNRAWGTAYQVFAISTVWVAIEWLRCNVMLEFPWLPLGATQSPLITMCQVADLGGPWIVSFWLAALNSLAAIAWINRHELRRCWPAGMIVACILSVTFLYGQWRLHSVDATPGPRVMVIQSSFPHLAGGSPTVDRQRSVAFFLDALPKLLSKQRADLVLLPEAEFPPLNREARSEPPPTGPPLESVYQQLLAIAQTHGTALVVGGNAVTDWTMRDGKRVSLKKLNCAYFIDPESTEIEQRYDKMHLVRFAERAMLTTGPDWLRRLALAISAGRANSPLQAGSLRDFRPFHWEGIRFITPICLENIDPAIVARMIWSDEPPGKAADFIANLSNDGWFAAQEHHQHLQSTVFRCIENRVPMVRCSNTGISVFIDSSGRILESIPVNTTGYAVRQIELDRRTTFYTQHGDVFVFTCLGLVAVAVVARILLLLPGWKRFVVSREGLGA